MNKEEEYAVMLAEEIAREIDEGIMSTILIKDGWVPVEFHFKDNYQAADINDWLNEHCKSKWARYGSDYLFKDMKDAEWFILKWL